MRASGIPAQYAQGTLSQSNAQALVLSMFPAGYQTVGTVGAGQTTSDPANDSTLLSETEAHYWFQFDTGSGMQNADPLMPGATIGQTFATPSTPGTFSEVPDSLREKTEVQLNAEFYSAGLFGLGSGLSRTTVLDETFNDVDLVGHPLTFGNFVNQNTAGSSSRPPPTRTSRTWKSAMKPTRVQGRTRFSRARSIRKSSRTFRWAARSSPACSWTSR